MIDACIKAVLFILTAGAFVLYLPELRQMPERDLLTLIAAFSFFAMLK